MITMNMVSFENFRDPKPIFHLIVFRIDSDDEWDAKPVIKDLLSFVHKNIVCTCTYISIWRFSFDIFMRLENCTMFMPWL